MGAGPFSGKKFNDLKKKWYDKLSKKGFEDIEQDEVHLKQYSGKTSLSADTQRTNESGQELELDPLYYLPWTKLDETSKYEYYSMCRQFLSTYKFKNKKERIVFELHTEGESIRIIADKVKSYRRKVHETLQRLVKVMRNVR